jgi:glucose/arabinose dehydrogenase
MPRSVLTAVFVIVPLVACAQVEQERPNTDFVPAFDGQTRAAALPVTSVRVESFAQGLENPWGIAALPGGAFLVTERPGRLRMVTAAGEVSAPLAGVPEVQAAGQGGLLDVAVPPDFATTREVWLTYAKPVAGGSVTAVARGVLSADGTALEGVRDVFLQSPVVDSDGHFGARIVFDGPDVFVTLGERQGHAALAQDAGATFGKVVRLTRDGAVAGGNPLGGAVWTMGHRNPQGAAVDAAGALWTVEHGPRGGDELNLIAPGANYGWPVVSYGENYSGRPVGDGIARAEGFVEPVYYWDPVIAPGGMTFYRGTAFAGWEGDLLIASLNPGGLVRLEIEGGRVTGEERMLEDVGRVRDVEELPDGTVLVLIDAGDGGILRVSPQG